MKTLLILLGFNLGELLHRQEHDPHRRHEGRPSLRRLLHSTDPQVRGAQPRTQSHQDVEACRRLFSF